MEDAKVAIIVLQYEKHDITKRFLESYVEYEDYEKYDLFLLDNNSPSGSKFDGFRLKYPFIHFIENEENVGFAKAINQVVKRLKHDFVFFINNDIVFESPAITMCYEKSLKSKSDAVTGNMLNPDQSYANNFSFSSQRPISLLFLNLSGLNKLLIGLYRILKFSGPIGYVNGGFLGIKNSTFREVGMFTEKYFMYTEDVDLMYKLNQHKAIMRVCIDAKFVHYHGTSSNKFWDKQSLLNLQLKQLDDYSIRNMNKYNLILFRIYILIRFRRKIWE